MRVVVEIDDETGQAAADYLRGSNERTPEQLRELAPKAHPLDRCSLLWRAEVMETWPPAPPPLQEGHLAYSPYNALVKVTKLGKQHAIVEDVDGLEATWPTRRLTYLGPCPEGWGERERPSDAPSPGDPVTPDTPVGTKVVRYDGFILLKGVLSKVSLQTITVDLDGGGFVTHAYDDGVWRVAGEVSR